jgi:pimeloyl-ACP methyl ester carboxylesterase
MQPYPGLETYGRSFDLPRSQVRLFAFVAGEPKPLTIVLLHGLGDEADSWRHLIVPLSAYGQVVAPDLPGFGRSEKPHRKYTIRFLAGAINELLELLDVSDVVMIGSSLGATIAHTIALERPAWLKGLVLIDGGLVNQAGRLNPVLLFYLLPGVGEWLYTRLRGNPQAAYKTLRPYYRDLDSLPAEEQRFLFLRVNQRVWDDAQRHAYLSTLRNLAAFITRQQKGLPERLSHLNVPTLILWGEDDRILPASNGKAAAAAQPTARFTSLSQACHLPQQECPLAVLQAILDDERFQLRS